MSERDERQSGPSRRLQDRQHLRLRQAVAGALTAWAVLASLSTVALVLQARQDSAATKQSAKAVRIAASTYEAEVALAEGQIANGCHRLNVQRAVSNGNALGQYRSLNTQVAILKRSFPQTAGLRALEHGDTLQAGRQQWLPLTDCRAAHDQGIAYRTPAPVEFRQELPPTSALTPGPDN